MNPYIYTFRGREIRCLGKVPSTLLTGENEESGKVKIEDLPNVFIPQHKATKFDREYFFSGLDDSFAAVCQECFDNYELCLERIEKNPPQNDEQLEGILEKFTFKIMLKAYKKRHTLTADSVNTLPSVPTGGGTLSVGSDTTYHTAAVGSASTDPPAPLFASTFDADKITKNVMTYLRDRFITALSLGVDLADTSFAVKVYKFLILNDQFEGQHIFKYSCITYNSEPETVEIATGIIQCNEQFSICLWQILSYEDWGSRFGFSAIEEDVVTAPSPVELGLLNQLEVKTFSSSATPSKLLSEKIVQIEKENPFETIFKTTEGEKNKEKERLNQLTAFGGLFIF